MQTKQTTGLRPMDKDYVTIVKQASDKVTGFLELYKEMERSISVTEKARALSPTTHGNWLTSPCITTGFRSTWMQNR